MAFLPSIVPPLAAKQTRHNNIKIIVNVKLIRLTRLYVTGRNYHGIFALLIGQLMQRSEIENGTLQVIRVGCILPDKWHD